MRAGHRHLYWGPALHLLKLLGALCLFAFPASAESVRFSCDGDDYEIDISNMQLSMNGRRAQRAEVEWNGAWFSFSTPESDFGLYHPLLRVIASFEDGTRANCQEHERPDLRDLPFPEYPEAQHAFSRLTPFERRAVQERLKDHHYYVSGIDGEWGPGMRRAMSDILVNSRLGSCRAPDLAQRDVAEAVFLSILETDFQLTLKDEGWVEFDGCIDRLPPEDVDETEPPRVAEQPASRTRVAATATFEDSAAQKEAIAAANAVCESEATVFGLCWRQTEEQRSIALGGRNFRRSNPDRAFQGPDKATVQWEGDTMTFSCEVFGVCNLPTDEVVRLISAEYEVAAASIHHDTSMIGQRFGPCVTLASGESICAVEMHLGGELGQLQAMTTGAYLFVLFKRGTAGKPPISFR